MIEDRFVRWSILTWIIVALNLNTCSSNPAIMKPCRVGDWNGNVKLLAMLHSTSAVLRYHLYTIPCPNIGGAPPSSESCNIGLRHYFSNTRCDCSVTSLRLNRYGECIYTVLNFKRLYSEGSGDIPPPRKRAAPMFGQRMVVLKNQRIHREKK